MKYYIVALFDNESYKMISPIQKNLSKKYRANRNSPQPYIVLGSLENPSVEKLAPVLEKVIRPYKKFKVELSDSVSISESTKTLNLKIQDMGYIKKISRSLNEMLQLHGFNLQNKTEEDLAISLANLNYFNKDKKNQQDTVQGNLNTTLKISRFELWRISNSRKETIMKSYSLPEF